MSALARVGEEGLEEASPHRAEIARRAGAIAHGTRRRRLDLALSADVSVKIDAEDRRAQALVVAGGGCAESRRTAALEFAAAAVTALVLERGLEDGEIATLVTDCAAAVGVARSAARLAVFMRALASSDVAQLPPQLAIDLVLTMVRELGGVEAVSVWTETGHGQVECVASAGVAATSRRLRTAARALLSDTDPAAADATWVKGVAITRWERPFAAIVARSRADYETNTAVYLAEAASALSPVFEREMLFERNAVREQQLVSASERRLLRLGCDLHDGPLQELVAFAEDLRYARDQVASLLGGPEAARVRGRFDDLEARLVSLDERLRDISHAVRSTSAVDRPLKSALLLEVEALNRMGAIQGRLDVEGDVSSLTASQKIALYRVVQEALSNARKHSLATTALVRLRATPSFVSVTVSDDGRGFDVDAARAKGRLGLSGVVERVRLLGGDIEIRSVPGRGAEVRATLPRWSPPKDEAPLLYAVTA
jgi:signal transduction histidine kinase